MLVAAAVAGGPATGCGPATPGVAPGPGERVTLGVTFHESIQAAPGAASDRFAFALRGRVSESGGARDPDASGTDRNPITVPARFVFLEASVTGTDGSVREIGCGDGFAQTTTERADDRARLRLLEELLPLDVSIAFEPGGAIVGIDGLGDAVGRAAATAAADYPAGAARAEFESLVFGLRRHLDEESLVERLREAGLGPPPKNVSTPRGESRRTVSFRVPGRGRSSIEATGAAGQGRDGSWVVRYDGAGSVGLTFDGDGGAPPPPAIGDVDPASVTVLSETEYERASRRPLRGHVGTEWVHAGGFRVKRDVEFTLTVAP